MVTSASISLKDFLLDGLTTANHCRENLPRKETAMLLPRHACVPCSLLVAFGLVLPAAPGQEANKPPKTKRASAEPDWRAGSIHVEVLFLALASGDAKTLDGIELTGPARDVKARIHELQQKGLITSVKTVQITTVERESTRSRMSESRPFVSGVTGFGGGFGGRGGGGAPGAGPGGGFGGRGGGGGGGPAAGPGGGPGPGAGPISRSISYREVGTSVQVKADAAPDGQVLVDLQVEDSHVRPAENAVAVGTEDKGATVSTPEVITTTLQTRLRVRPGHMVMAQGTKTMSKSAQAQAVILLTLNTDDASTKDAK
jgi:hypothetical protein